MNERNEQNEQNEHHSDTNNMEQITHNASENSDFGASEHKSHSGEVREHTHSEHSSHHSSSGGSSSSHHSSSGGSSSSHHSSSGGSSSSHHSSSGGGSSHRHSSSYRSKKKDDSAIKELAKKYQVVTEPDTKVKDVTEIHTSTHRHRKRRSPIVKVLRMLAAVIAVLIIALLSTFVALNRLGKSEIKGGTPVGIEENDYAKTYDEGKTVEYNGVKYLLDEDVIAVALMGVDKEELGTKEGIIGTAGQADTILIATMNVKTGEIKIISVPRDLMAEVDLYTVSGKYVGVKNMQICLAYAYGNGTDTSCKNVITSLERVFYGIPINLYAALDLEGISKLNDAIDGVTVTALETVGQFTEGQEITLYGDNAVSYVRTRKSTDVNADTYRRQRQIQYIKAFSNKAIKYALNNFSIVPNLYNTAIVYSHTNVTLSMVTYLATTIMAKGIDLDNFIQLKGEMKRGEEFAEFYIDEVAALETVLDVFYDPIAQ